MERVSVQCMLLSKHEFTMYGDFYWPIIVSVTIFEIFDMHF